MRRLILLTALTLSFRAATAQTVSGYVTSAETLEPLGGVNVYTADAGTVTNQAGFYRLELEAGPVELHISHVGFEPEILRFTLEGDLRRDVSLTPVAIGMDEVEVVGEREGRISTISLPVAEIERLPAFLGEVDVIKTLQLLPGVQSGNEGSTGLYVRGGGPDQNLILLDSAPIYNVSHILGFLSVFNASSLEEVNLIKGGFPARYGGRLSSVVDLRMREGSRERYGVDGTVGLVFSSLTAEGPLSERGSFIVSARRTYIDVLARPFMHNWLQDGEELGAYFYDGSAKLSYYASARSRLAWSIFLGGDAYASTVETAAKSVTERNTAAADWGNVVSTLGWHYLASPRLSGRASLTMTRYRFDVLNRLTQIGEEATSEQIAYGSGIFDWTAALDFDYRAAARHQVRFGANLTRHRFNPGVTRLSVSGTVDSTLSPDSFPFSGLEAFAFAENEIDLGSRFEANAGLHGSVMNVNGVTYSSLQPRVSLQLQVNSAVSLLASFSTMRQYLHLLTNSGLNLPTDLWVAATDRIRPQDAWQAALGAAYERGALLVGLEAYFKRMSGLIEYKAGASFAGPGQDWQEMVEVGDGRSYGVELFVRRTAGRTTGWLGYTLSWSDRRFAALNGGKPFPYRYDRRHDLSFVLAHRLSERVDLGATWVYGTGQAVTLATARFHDGRVFDLNNLAGATLRQYGSRGGYRMAPYHRLDFAFNWRVGVPFIDKGEGTLSFGAYNVYNRRNPFFLFEARRPDGSRAYRQASLFPIIPFVGYRFSF